MEAKGSTRTELKRQFISVCLFGGGEFFSSTVERLGIPVVDRTKELLRRIDGRDEIAFCKISNLRPFFFFCKNAIQGLIFLLRFLSSSEQRAA